MKDETLLPDVASLEKVLEWIAGLPVPTKSATANYCRLKNFIIDYNAALQSGNSGQPVTVPAGYVLVSADFIDTVKQAFKEVGGRKSFPGHAHDVPGVWDSDNGEKANKPCAQCAMWSKLHDMLAAAPKAPDGWIPVSERMPDKVGLYLCWGTYFDGAEPDYIPASFFIHPTNGWSKWEPVEDDCDPNCVTITHWQPLPDAPKVTP